MFRVIFFSTVLRPGPAGGQVDDGAGDLEELVKAQRRRSGEAGLLGATSWERNCLEETIIRENKM